MLSEQKLKKRKLFFSILLDLTGLVSYLIPGAGEFSDIIWAPVSAYILAKMYPGKIGKIGAIVNFIEEISPGTDIIPTFTLTWIYTYWLNSKNE
ncbi:hypothetical protein [Myroides indicus]|uniref:Uncharacterized protein n=1 Tax=Myroides indicus TaxID=1323422 RepID=A0A4R7FEG2_9FLAO|nr:hypothetical protein [Myroides indicus]TDS66116.1 hypothetical protein C8P70_1019 [Myroides indicus]